MNGPDSLNRVTVTEAARRLGVHPNTIRNWAKTGYLKVEYLPSVSGWIRVPLAEVERHERIRAERDAALAQEGADSGYVSV